jgi:hypothetical protein
MLKRFEYKLARLLPLTLLFVLFSTIAFADTDEPPEWVNLYSYSSTLNGGPLPVGALVDVYDPDNVLCGSFTVHTEGRYGFLPAMRDIDVTPSIDEGADPGDPLELRINGVHATALGPDEAIWTSNGDNKEVDLSVEYLIDVDVRPLPDGIGTPAMYTLYYSWVVNTGDGIDFFHLEASSAHAWSVEIIGSSTTDYVAPGDSVEVGVRTLVPADAEDGDSDDMTLTATSAMDGTVFDSEVVTTTVTGSAAGEWEGIVPGVFKLFQNYPNPFNPTTRIEFTLEQASEVRLEVYNVLGQKIRTLLEGYFPNGSHEAEWDGMTESGAKVSSGIYFYRLSTNEFSRTRKMMLMK